MILLRYGWRDNCARCRGKARGTVNIVAVMNTLPDQARMKRMLEAEHSPKSLIRAVRRDCDPTYIDYHGITGATARWLRGYCERYGLDVPEAELEGYAAEIVRKAMA